jgi:hypothetical protein
MKKLLILGAGGYGKTVLDVAQQLGSYEKIAFLDDHAAGPNVLGKCAEYFMFADEDTDVYPAFGNNETRMQWLERLEEEGAAGQGKYRAWYEVNEQGRLYLRTNVPGNTESGYWVLVELKFKDGSVSHDSQGVRSMAITYSFTSLLSVWDRNQVVDQVNLYIFRDHTGREEFWDTRRKLDSEEKALEAFRDDLVVEFTLENDIFTESKKDVFEVTSLSITRNEAAQEETYTAYISSEIMEQGEYGIIYEGKTSGQLASMSYIGRGDGCLTFTREIDHFADPGASGTFYITHSEFRQQEDGNIVCSSLWSPGYPYQLGT